MAQLAGAEHLALSALTEQIAVFEAEALRAEIGGGGHGILWRTPSVASSWSTPSSARTMRRLRRSEGFLASRGSLA